MSRPLSESGTSGGLEVGFEPQLADAMNANRVVLLIIWGLLLFFGAQHRRKLALLPVLLTAFVGLAYLINWRAIIAWHLD